MKQVSAPEWRLRENIHNLRLLNFIIAVHTPHSCLLFLLFNIDVSVQLCMCICVLELVICICVSMRVLLLLHSFKIYFTDQTVQRCVDVMCVCVFFLSFLFRSLYEQNSYRYKRRLDGRSAMHDKRTTNQNIINLLFCMFAPRTARTLSLYLNCLIE